MALCPNSHFRFSNLCYFSIIFKHTFDFETDFCPLLKWSLLNLNVTDRECKPWRMHVKTVYPMCVSFLLVFHGCECSCMWLSDSSLGWSFLPLGLALTFCPPSDSLSSLAYRPNLQAFPFQVMRVVWNPAILLQNPRQNFAFPVCFKMSATISFIPCSAVSYSQPILSGPIRNSDSTGEEVIFNCRSGSGYPQPNVYWINKVNNSRLSPSKTEIIPYKDGTFSVFSTLIVKATSNMQIECSIENEMLQENLSANCKSFRAASCFLGSRNINQCVSVCKCALMRAVH